MILGPALHVLLVSSHPTEFSFFEGLVARQAHTSEWPFAVTLLPADEDALTQYAGGIEGAAVALVDVYPTPEVALRVCQSLWARWPDLPVLAWLCCSRVAGPQELEALRSAGANLSGAHASPDRMVAAVRSVVSGEGVLDVRTARNRPGAPDLPGGRAGPDGGSSVAQALTAEDTRLLVLVAEGHTDREIGARLHLSPRTAQRDVARLSAAVGARGRAHLAAWAVTTGVYRFAPDPDSLGGSADAEAAPAGAKTKDRSLRRRRQVRAAERP